MYAPRGILVEEEEIAELEEETVCPLGNFSCDRGYLYIDRIGYRIPSNLSKQVGLHLYAKAKSENPQNPPNKRKKKPIQRSLTPHLDCCPDAILRNDYSSASKWRPLQSFVSLTDNLLPETGGFEAAPGFHRGFCQWARVRAPAENGAAPPCVGEFTPVRPVEDREVLDRIRHVGCRAGGVVVWDVRIPHANARRNDGTVPRAVVYASFLPDVELNRRYARNQLQNYLERKKPTDQWLVIGSKDSPDDEAYYEREDFHCFSPLGRNLMGTDPWGEGTD